MQNLADIEKSMTSLTKEDFNNELVFYCSHCLSLKILSLNDNVDFCDECGNTDIEKTHISNWEEMYKNKYKKSFRNGRE